MPVGYLPDMFGHVAQMPQLLRLAGLEHAVVWRGVPAAIDQTAFWWEAPDGSRVRAEYLYGSYSNGRDLPDDAKQLVARAHGYEIELGPARLPDGGAAPHERHRPPAAPAVARPGRRRGQRRSRTTTASSSRRSPSTSPSNRPTGLRDWRGELRSGARANVLMGVASNRVDVHQACAAAERAIERRAEPLSALLLLAPSGTPTALLDVAWRKLVLNSAHDSSCACSADEVVDAVMVRYQEARQVGDGLARDAARRARGRDRRRAGARRSSSTPPQHDRGGGHRRSACPATVPSTSCADDGTRCPAQVLRTVGGDGFSTTVTGQKVRWVLELHARPGVRRAAGHPGRAPHGGRRRRRRRRSTPPGPTTRAIDLEELREELLELGERGATIRFRQVLAPTREVLARRRRRPRLRLAHVRRGRAATAPRPASSPGSACSPTSTSASTVDPDDGTFSVTTDGRRRGERPQPARRRRRRRRHVQLLAARPGPGRRPAGLRCAVNTLESGPVRARLLVVALYRVAEPRGRQRAWCVRRGEETALVEVRTTLELHADERFVRVRTELDNRCRDHRLRAHFPLPAPVDRSDAECAFAVVERGLTTEGGPHEAAAADVRVAPVRRRLRRRGRARRPPRRPARVRGGRRRHRARAHAAARHRLPVAHRAAAAPEPGRAARPARRPAAPAPSRRRVRGAPPPRRLARGAAPRRRRRVPRAARARARRRTGRTATPDRAGRSGSWARSSPRSRANRAASWSGSPTSLRARPSRPSRSTARRARAGSSTSSAARSSPSPAT